MTEFYIWKDVLDCNNFMLGMKYKEKYSAWTILYIDGLYDLFGEEVQDTMKKADPGVPIKFHIEIKE